MSETTNVDSNNYEIVEFFPVIGEDGKVLLEGKNAKTRCNSPKSRDKEETVKIPAYDGGNPQKQESAKEAKGIGE